MRVPTSWWWIGLAGASMAQAVAQSAACADQGRLSDGSRPANGTDDFRAELFGVINGGTPVAAAQTFSGVGITNGLFQLSVDFGSGAVRHLHYHPIHGEWQGRTPSPARTEAGVAHSATCWTAESGAGSVRAIRCPGSDPGGCAERSGLRRGETCRMPVISRP